MEKALAQFSVVILGNVHDPSVLNPDFLALKGIVPTEWNWKVAQPVLVSPHFSLVQYDSGVSVTVEHSRLQIMDGRVPGGEGPRSKGTEIAKAYVRSLPHVRYTAVGFNFNFIVRMEDPKVFLRTRFIRSGPWDAPPYDLDTIGLRFLYSLSERKAVVSLDAGEAKQVERGDEEAIPAVLVNVNFHRDCAKFPAERQILGYLDRIGEDWQACQDIMCKVLEGEAQP